MDNLIQQSEEIEIQRPPFGGRWHSFEASPNKILVAHRYTDVAIKSTNILGRPNESYDGWHAIGPLASTLLNAQDSNLTQLFSLLRSSKPIGTFYPNEVIIARDSVIIGYEETENKPFPYDAVRAACFASGRSSLEDLKNSGASKKQINEFQSNFDAVAYEVLMDIYEDLKKFKDVGLFVKMVFSQIENERMKEEFIKNEIINQNGWEDFLKQ